ncbi:tRNA pseudouridine55 synthase [Actinopolymorpha cephalotaxi]|uniref:tRNA pseudouridine synthase B n=1 Tax=Actinopolymorpha cephalotaxi TaxID=504797 RepID=A0A1I2R965_9ACTN|nr:tRNA pseudouridine(55) synthase TruB [Actinopolymorpha cephalotaxi]NYH82306.1 tRNA pseudouridine55 synthase [Actinopolymorpha cephalotaxi]SFG37255.1 tRNA pseudouridine55 synthase [Actinopolymorpha cephalotaxi]
MTPPDVTRPDVPRPAETRSGIVVVDKPSGWTSHDVVGKVRRLAHTRRVGHAGTLDPMATGVLVLGIERATRLLGYLTLTEKAYDATIRLGVSTRTDDAEGEAIAQASARDVRREDIQAGVAALTGEISQVPSAVSAVKVAGERAYRKVHKGEDVELAPRQVVVRRFEVTDVRPVGEVVDVDVVVECSSGTYVRALARDLGAGLGVGGHLTALRRTRVGPYALDQARTIEQLEGGFEVVPIADVAARTFARYDVDEHTARLVSFGQKLPGVRVGGGPVGVFGPDGAFLALYEDVEEGARPVAVFAS